MRGRHVAGSLPRLWRWPHLILVSEKQSSLFGKRLVLLSDSAMELVSQNVFLFRFSFVGFFLLHFVLKFFWWGFEIRIETCFLSLFVVLFLFCSCRDLWCNGTSWKVYMFNIWDWLDGRFPSIFGCYSGRAWLCCSSNYGSSLHSWCELIFKLINAFARLDLDKM